MKKKRKSQLNTDTTLLLSPRVLPFVRHFQPAFPLGMLLNCIIILLISIKVIEMFRYCVQALPYGSISTSKLNLILRSLVFRLFLLHGGTGLADWLMGLI